MQGLAEHKQFSQFPNSAGGSYSNPNFLGCTNTLFAVTLCLAFLSLYPIWLFLADFWIPLLFPLCCSVFEVTFFSSVVFLSSLFVPMSCLSHRDSTQSTVLSTELLLSSGEWRKASFPEHCVDGPMPQHRIEILSLLPVSVLSPRFRYYIFIYIFSKYFIMESIFLVECIRSSCSQSLLTLCRFATPLSTPNCTEGLTYSSGYLFSHWDCDQWLNVLYASDLT